jgi:hypothetical protein
VRETKEKEWKRRETKEKEWKRRETKEREWKRRETKEREWTTYPSTLPCCLLCTPAYWPSAHHTASCPSTLPCCLLCTLAYWPSAHHTASYLPSLVACFAHQLIGTVLTTLLAISSDIRSLQRARTMMNWKGPGVGSPGQPREKVTHSMVVTTINDYTFFKYVFCCNLGP